MSKMDHAWKSVYDSRAKRECLPDYKKSCWSQEGFMELLELTMQFVDEIKSDDDSVQSVLDVGCGPGNYCDELFKKGFDVTGMDYSAEMISLAKKNYPAINFVVGNGYDIKFDDQSFDLAISIGALQCLMDSEKFLKEISRVSSKYLIISTLWRDDDGKDPMEILKKQLIDDSWPTREYNIKEILPILESQGFSLVKMVRNNPSTGAEIRDGYFIVAKRNS